MTRSPRLLVATLAALTLTTFVGAPTLAAKPTGSARPAGQPTIHVDINVDQENFCGVPGFDAPGPDARVILKRDGVVLRDVTVPVVEGGFFEAIWGCGPDKRYRPTIGDRIEASSGDQKTSVTVRDLRPTFDLVKDIVRGTARPGRLEVTIIDCVIGLFCTGDRIYRFPRIADDGSWSVDTDQFDLRGGDAAFIAWTHRGNTIFQKFIAPHLTARNGVAQVTGHATPGKRVTVTLEAADGTPKGSGTARVDKTGRFEMVLRQGGAPAIVATGDVLRSDVFRDATLKVLEDALVLDRDTGLLTATCRPNAQWVYRLRVGPGGWYATGGNADRTGSIREEFTVLPDDLPFGPDASIKLWCASPTGNSQLFYALPS